MPSTIKFCPRCGSEAIIQHEVPLGIDAVEIQCLTCDFHVSLWEKEEEPDDDDFEEDYDECHNCGSRDTRKNSSDLILCNNCGWEEPDEDY